MSNTPSHTNDTSQKQSFDWNIFRKSLNVGDQVLANGIVGTIVAFEGDFCRLKIAEGVLITALIDVITDKKIK